MSTLEMALLFIILTGSSNAHEEDWSMGNLDSPSSGSSAYEGARLMTSAEERQGMAKPMAASINWTSFLGVSR